MSEQTLSFRKKLLYSVITIILISCAMMTAAEAIVRLFHPESSTEYGYSPDRDPYLRDRLIGKRFKPSLLEVWKQPEFEGHFTTNSSGFRSTEEFVGTSAQDRVIAVLGDSMVQAVQVDDDRTFPKLLENALKRNGVTQVQNYGMSGLGCVHYLMVYRYYARIRHPEWVIITITDANDVRNSSPTLEQFDVVRPNYVIGQNGDPISVTEFAVLPEHKPRPLALRIKTFLASDSAVYRLMHATGLKRQLQADQRVSIKPKLPMDDFNSYEEPWNNDFEAAWRY